MLTSLFDLVFLENQVKISEKIIWAMFYEWREGHIQEFRQFWAKWKKRPKIWHKMAMLSALQLLCSTERWNAYHDFQLSKAQEKFGHDILMFKLPRYQGQLASFPKETVPFSDKACEKLSDVIDSCSLP